MLINEKTKIPLHWAITIMVSLGGLAATGATAHYRLSKAEAAVDVLKEKRHEDDKRLQRVEDKLDALKESVDRAVRMLQKNER